MSVWAKGAYFWRSAAQGVRHAPFVHGIAVLTIAIALFTAGLARGGTALLDGLVSSLGGAVELTVYVQPDATGAEVDAIAQLATERAGSPSRRVSAEEALQRLTRELGPLGAVLHDLPDNPLPLSIEVAVASDRRTPERLAAIAEALRAAPGVDAVDYGEQAVTRLSAIARAARYGGGLASLIVALATIVIVAATLQLAIYARREEIEIQRLVGATDRFVKAPFLIEGMIQGLLGAGVAAIGLWAFAQSVGPRLTQLFAFLTGPGVAPTLLSVHLLGELFAAGAALGLCGSFIAVGRFQRV